MAVNVTHAPDAWRTWMQNVSAAAAAFESRWTALALRRVDPGLAEDLGAQQELWHEAQFLYRSRGDGHAELVAQGAAMCRGYTAAVAAMEASGAPDDAYQLGRCPRTGTTVAIGQQKAALARVREVHGEGVVWLTPDEVASLFGSVEALKAIGAIKRRFPGAEVVERYPGEPDQQQGEGATKAAED